VRNYFFFEGFVFFFTLDFEEAFDFASLLSILFILEALFLWISFFFEARSAKAVAFCMLFLSLFFFAIRIAASSRVLMTLFTSFFLCELLLALLAVFVTGIIYFILPISRNIPCISLFGRCEYNLTDLKYQYKWL